MIAVEKVLLADSQHAQHTVLLYLQVNTVVGAHKPLKRGNDLLE